MTGVCPGPVRKYPPFGAVILISWLPVTASWNGCSAYNCWRHRTIQAAGALAAVEHGLIGYVGPPALAVSGWAEWARG